MKIVVKIRVTADSQADADAARTYLESSPPGLCLAKGRKGSNPKYADDPKILAYGDLQIAAAGSAQPKRRRGARP